MSQYMTVCNLKINKDDLWQCPDCNWIYKPRHPTFLCRKPPHRNCPTKRGQRTEDRGQLSPEQIAEAERQQAQAAWSEKHGPGAHLHRLIEKWTGEGITGGCGCGSWIAKMNRNPPQWTRDNVEGIIDKMLAEVDRRLVEPQTLLERLERIEAMKPIPAPERIELTSIRARLATLEAPSWRLRLGGLDLPGRRLAVRRLILVAVKRSERSLDRHQPQRIA